MPNSQVPISSSQLYRYVTCLLVSFRFPVKTKTTFPLPTSYFTNVRVPGSRTRCTTSRCQKRSRLSAPNQPRQIQTQIWLPQTQVQEGVECLTIMASFLPILVSCKLFQNWSLKYTAYFILHPFYKRSTQVISKVISTACASKKNKTFHLKAFCATHRLLSCPKLMCVEV